MWFTLGKILLGLSRRILIIIKQFLLCSVTAITLSGIASTRWPNHKQSLLPQPGNERYHHGSNIIFSDMTYYLYGESDITK